MTRQEAKQLLPLINTPEFIQLFETLIEVRLQHQLKALANVQDEVELRWVQGKCQELKSLKGVREKILGVAKDEERS